MIGQRLHDQLNKGAFASCSPPPQTRRRTLKGNEETWFQRLGEGGLQVSNNAQMITVRATYSGWSVHAGDYDSPRAIADSCLLSREIRTTPSRTAASANTTRSLRELRERVTVLFESKFKISFKCQQHEDNWPEIYKLHLLRSLWGCPSYLLLASTRRGFWSLGAGIGGSTSARRRAGLRGSPLARRRIGLGDSVSAAWRRRQELLETTLGLGL